MRKSRGDLLSLYQEFEQSADAAPPHKGDNESENAKDEGEFPMQG